ncbi:hypothetical protein EVAR_29093_1 [Eumeta japonica]|uniref:Uncharacterized protein n=1 Tax=Eumeta variegata TaxID=151549 RepID=A0A4C1VME7_EUMVA|nr:hypothetical protein EVAR_29093_1 [Eumeta japonica]
MRLRYDLGCGCALDKEYGVQRTKLCRCEVRHESFAMSSSVVKYGGEKEEPGSAEPAHCIIRRQFRVVLSYSCSGNLIRVLQLYSNQITTTLGSLVQIETVIVNGIKVEIGSGPKLRMRQASKSSAGSGAEAGRVSEIRNESETGIEIAGKTLIGHGGEAAGGKLMDYKIGRRYRRKSI